MTTPDRPDASNHSSTPSLHQMLMTLANPAGPVSSCEESGTQPLPAQTLAPKTDRDTAAPVRGESLSGLQPSDQLDKYLILDVLGRGGMGIVFKARDTILDRIVAIKVLGPMLADNAAARRRFIQEGRAAAAIKHQHVVTVYGVEGHETSPYLVLEYVEGRSLEEVLATAAPLPVDEVIRLGTQIAEGLAAAHQKGLVHRDIKPANVLLENETGRVTITDFGLARAVDDPLASNGELCGTPHYMAPEQVCGGAIDHRADLFSLGSVLYFMCTGELPFAAPHSVAVLHRVLDDQPRPIQEFDRDGRIPAWLIELIGTLHAKDPNRRLQTAAEVKEALNARRGGESATDLVRAVARVSATEPERSHALARPAFALLLGVVFLLSLPAFYLLKPGKDRAAGEEREGGPALAATERRPDSRETPKQPAEVTPPQTTAPQRPAVGVEPAPKGPARPKPARDGKKPKRSPRQVKGIVVVLVNDLPSQTFFRAEGLSLRHQRTSEVVTLKAGRNDLALGEYSLEQTGVPAGLTISPRRFTVVADRSVVVYVTHKQDDKSPSPRGGNGFPPEPPPFPPPFGPPGPPPRPRR